MGSFHPRDTGSRRAGARTTVPSPLSTTGPVSTSGCSHTSRWPHKSRPAARARNPAACRPPARRSHIGEDAAELVNKAREWSPDQAPPHSAASDFPIGSE